jgi:hypothetical protein
VQAASLVWRPGGAPTNDWTLISDVRRRYSSNKAAIGREINKRSASAGWICVWTSKKQLHFLCMWICVLGMLVLFWLRFSQICFSPLRTAEKTRFHERQLSNTSADFVTMNWQKIWSRSAWLDVLFGPVRRAVSTLRGMLKDSYLINIRWFLEWTTSWEWRPEGAPTTDSGLVDELQMWDVVSVRFTEYYLLWLRVVSKKIHTISTIRVIVQSIRNQ